MKDKLPPTLLISILYVIVSASILSCSGLNNENKDSLQSKYFLLNGEAIAKGNAIEEDGSIVNFKNPVLHLFYSGSKSPKGTVLLLAGREYEKLNMKPEAENTALYLNSLEFDVAVLEYHVGKDSQVRELALIDALEAFRYLKLNKETLELKGEQLGIIGFSSGGNLAARTVQRLEESEQADFVILISPSEMNETISGTVIPAIVPPQKPTARLLTLISNEENEEYIKSSQEYTKTWIGYDGRASFELIGDSDFHSAKNKNPMNESFKLPAIIEAFLENEQDVYETESNPAAIPSEGHYPKRHQEKLQLVKNNKYELILLGNSLIHNFEKPDYQPIWNQFYGPRKAVNLGYSGYRTENILWNIENGELDGQSPKVIVLEIGTNNVDEKNYPTRHTAGQLAGGIEAIVKLIRVKLPDTKIIVLRSFPGCYGGPNPTSHRAILDRASEIASKLDDGEHVFYCDVNHIFLNLDGTIKHEFMPDWLHPNPEGAKLWAQAMEPLLSKLMDDASLDNDISENTAIVPISKLENDSYNWWERHNDILSIKDSLNPEIVLIGNSITHIWGGPLLKYADGTAREPNGPVSWNSAFQQYRVLNLGFGWDRTQNVLWRLDRGELDGLHPRVVIIHIGTNNTSETVNARMNTAPEIIEGIVAICARVRSKVPHTKIVLMAVFPREQYPENPRRMLINEINKELKAFSEQHRIELIDIGPLMLNSDGTFPKENAGDFCHPTEKGYQIWADAIKEILDKP